MTEPVQAAPQDDGVVCLDEDDVAEILPPQLQVPSSSHQSLAAAAVAEHYMSMAEQNAVTEAVGLHSLPGASESVFPGVPAHSIETLQQLAQVTGQPGGFPLSLVPMGETSEGALIEQSLSGNWDPDPILQPGGETLMQKRSPKVSSGVLVIPTRRFSPFFTMENNRWGLVIFCGRERQ